MIANYLLCLWIREREAAFPEFVKEMSIAHSPDMSHLGKQTDLSCIKVAVIQRSK